MNLTVIWRSLLGAGAIIHRFVCNEKRVMVMLQTAYNLVVRELQHCISTVTLAMSGTNLFLATTIHPLATIPIGIALIIIIIIIINGKGLLIYISQISGDMLSNRKLKIFSNTKTLH